MVYDTLENLSQYTGMFDHLDTAIEFIQNHDLNDLPLGKTEIDGENVFVNVIRCPPRDVRLKHIPITWICILIYAERNCAK